MTVFEQDASPYARPRDWNFGIYCKCISQLLGKDQEAKPLSPREGAQVPLVRQTSMNTSSV